MSIAKHVRIELCDVCACQVRVPPSFKGSRVLCWEHRTPASKRRREEDAANRAYEDDCAEFEERCRLVEEEPWDEICEDHLDLPPVSSIVHLRDWVVRLDIRGSRRLASYDRSHMTPSADK